MADITGTLPDGTERPEPINADVYVNTVAEGAQKARWMGTCKVGLEYKIPLVFAASTQVEVRAVPRGPMGQTYFGDPADFDPVTVTVPGLGGGTLVGTEPQVVYFGPGGGATSTAGFEFTTAEKLLTTSVYELTRQAAPDDIAVAPADRFRIKLSSDNVPMVSLNGTAWENLLGYSYVSNEHTLLPQRRTLNYQFEFITATDYLGRTDISSKRTPTGVYNAVTDGLCSGDGRFYRCSFTAGNTSLTILETFWDAGTHVPTPYRVEGTVHSFRVGQAVWIRGGNGAGVDHYTTITAVAGNVLTLAAAPSTTQNPGDIRHDETDHIEAALTYAKDNHLRCHFPAGGYLLPRREVRFPESLSGLNQLVEITGDGDRATTFFVMHTGHGFRMDRALSGGSLVHTRMRHLGIQAVQRDSVEGLPTDNYGSGIAQTCTTLNVDGVPEGDVTDFHIEGVFIQGFGCWGFISQNMQSSHIKDITCWWNKMGSIALIGNNDTRGTSQKECNAITLERSFIQYSPFVQDAAQTGTGSISARSRQLTLSFTPTGNITGRIIHVSGAGVGGRTHATFVESYSGNILIISMPVYQAASGQTVKIYPTNVANVYAHNANNLLIIGGTHQQNWGKADFTAAVNTASGIRAENLDSLRVQDVWYEDTGGEDGASIDLYNTYSTTIEGCHVGGARKSSPEVPSGHGVGIRLDHTRGTTVQGCYMGQSGTGTPFQLNNYAKGTTLKATFIENQEQWNNVDETSEFPKFDDGTLSQTFSLNRNTVRLLDDLWVQLLVNGNFLDRAGANPAGWTISNGSLYTMQPASGFTGIPGRFSRYLQINTQGMGSGGETTAVYQDIAIEDAAPTGDYTLGFDAHMTNRGAGGATNNFVVVRFFTTPSGTDSSAEFVATGDPLYLFATGRTQRYQMRVRLPAGTSRSLRVQIGTTTGPNTPIVRLGNFRVVRGTAVAHDGLDAVSEAGGTVRSSIGFVEHGATPSVTYLKQVAGQLQTSPDNSAWTPIGGAGSFSTTVPHTWSAKQTFTVDPEIVAASAYLDLQHTDTAGSAGLRFKNGTPVQYGYLSSSYGTNKFLTLGTGLADIPVSLAWNNVTALSAGNSGQAGDGLPVIGIGGPLALYYSATAPPLSSVNQAWIYYDTASDQIKYSKEGGAWTNLVGAGGGSVGPGTVNYLPRFLTTTTIGDSGFQDDGSVAYVHRTSTQFRGQGADIADAVLVGSSGAYGAVRYEKRAGQIAVENTNGEIQFLLNSSSPAIAWGDKISRVNGSFKIYPPVGNAINPLEIYESGSTTNQKLIVLPDGDLYMIRGIKYHWPSANPTGAGGAQKYLTLNINSGGTNIHNLTWVDPPGGTFSPANAYTWSATQTFTVSPLITMQVATLGFKHTDLTTSSYAGFTFKNASDVQYGFLTSSYGTTNKFLILGTGAADCPIGLSWNDVTSIVCTNSGQAGNTLPLIDLRGPLQLYPSATVPPLAPANQVWLYYDTASDQIKYSKEGAAYANLVGAGGLSGSGTTNTLAKFTASTTVGDSAVTDDGSRVRCNRLDLDVKAPATDYAHVNFLTQSSVSATWRFEKRNANLLTENQTYGEMQYGFGGTLMIGKFGAQASLLSTRLRVASPMTTTAVLVANGPTGITANLIEASVSTNPSVFVIQPSGNGAVTGHFNQRARVVFDQADGYVLEVTDSDIFLSATTARTVKLPPAAGYAGGRLTLIWINYTGTSTATVTVVANTGETLDVGSLAHSPGGRAVLTGDGGTYWYTLYDAGPA